MKEKKLYERIKKALEQVELYDTLEAVNELIEECKCRNYYKDENFKYRDQVDYYLYQVEYEDGRKSLFCKGRQAWDRFTFCDDAVRVVQLTKDLYPEKKVLITKEMH